MGKSTRNDSYQRPSRLILPLILAIFLSSLAHTEEEYKFDLSEIEKEIEKKPYHLAGYIEFRPVLFFLDRDASLYKLRFYDRNEGKTTEELDSKLQLDGSLEKGIARLFIRLNSDLKYSYLGWDGEINLYEGFLSMKPSSSFTIDLGKKTFKWGKGYAWNPVAFIDRPKNPDDPEIPLEGFVAASADYIKSFPDPLKTVSFTPVILPVYDHVNDEFGEVNNINFAGKLYFLFFDTDVDFLFLLGKSKTNRFGIDFSRNITTNFEIHGEFAFINNFKKKYVDSFGSISESKLDAKSYLFGIRYLTKSDITFIAEYYRNGTGFSRVEMKDYFTFIDRGYDYFLRTGNDSLLKKAERITEESYGRINPMKDYVYFRVSQKEPLNILYFTPSITAIMNLNDNSLSVSPELLYTGFTNVELRLKATALIGQKESEYGEKPNDYRFEIRFRYYFDAVKAAGWAKRKLKGEKTSEGTQ
jgi:hypothetical protein